MIDLVEEVIQLNIKQLVGWVLVVSAVNWGLVGLMDLNLVDKVFGTLGLTKVVYMVVGLVGVYKAYWMLTGGKK